MMNCQSEDCASSSSRAACASTGRAAAVASAAGAASQKASSKRHSRSQVQEVRPLEPPVPEQLGIERRHDNAVRVGLLLREAVEQMNEVGGMLLRPLMGHRRLVRALPAQVDVRTAHAPQLQAEI